MWLLLNPHLFAAGKNHCSFPHEVIATTKVQLRPIKRTLINTVFFSLAESQTALQPIEFFTCHLKHL
jgi:hypothetical protein